MLTLGLAAFCVLSVYRSPWHPWLSVAGLLTATASAASGSLAAKRQRYLVWASVLGEVTFVFWWAHVGHKLSLFENSGYDFASLNVVIFVLPSLVSVWIKVRKEANEPSWKSIFSLHHLMMAFMLVAVAMLAFVHWQSANAQLPRPAFLMAIAATAITIWATHWDRQSHRQPLLLYGLGLICVAPLLQAFRLEPKELPWSLAVVLSAYSWLPATCSVVGMAYDSFLSLANYCPHGERPTQILLLRSQIPGALWAQI
ncbi:MAG: hypothetical protein R3C28_12575 [Pirellulaceae bacterium]